MDIILKIGEDSNGLEIHSLEINGDEVQYIQDLSDCPEDAHIGRDLIDGNDIISYIQLGYNAAKNGEELNITYEDLEEE